MFAAQRKAAKTEAANVTMPLLLNALSLRANFASGNVVFLRSNLLYSLENYRWNKNCLSRV